MSILKRKSGNFQKETKKLRNFKSDDLTSMLESFGFFFTVKPM